MQYFLQGLTMGMAYVAPIGMQNLFVINSALAQSKRRACLTALIIIFFDISLSLACFYGVGVLLERLPVLEQIILFVGSLIVIYIGIGLLRSKEMTLQHTDVNLPIIKVISMAFAVAWLNPQAILDGTMILGAFKATVPQNFGTSFIIGVMSASCIWFFGITGLVSIFKQHFNEKILKGINLVCGMVITFYGLRLGVHFIEKIL